MYIDGLSTCMPMFVMYMYLSLAIFNVIIEHVSYVDCRLMCCNAAMYNLLASFHVMYMYINMLHVYM